MRFLYSGTVKLPTRFLIRNEILKHTSDSEAHLTPEIKLKLLSPRSPIWTMNPEHCKFCDPFWAFYWAGGQALSRYVLDHPSEFMGKRILDVGSGCGASAIAAAKARAGFVIANDIDRIACEAISLNAHVNNTKVHILQRNIIGTDLITKCDSILVGDMFYESEMGEALLKWLISQHRRGISVFVGDPGRYVFTDLGKKIPMVIVGDYNLLPETAAENNGFTTSCVWKFKCY